MPKSFNWRSLRNNPTALSRVIVGALVLANLIAAWFVIWPPGGSPEALARQLEDNTAQIRQQHASVDRTRTLVGKIETGRTQGDMFLAKYFMPRRVAYSMIIGQINEMAKNANIRPKESAFTIDEIDGSDTLSMMTIAAGYEGTYADLMKFLGELDRSNQLFIIESLGATPQQGTQALNITLKLNCFVNDAPAAAAGGVGGL